MYMFDTLKSYEINIGGDEWGMNILCDTLSQAKEISRVLKTCYAHEKVYIEYLEIEQKGTILEKVI
jgi:hypothetical protein